MTAKRIASGDWLGAVFMFQPAGLKIFSSREDRTDHPAEKKESNDRPKFIRLRNLIDRSRYVVAAYD
jgi:hypothetical protein